jgi:hypothetical protein
MLKSWLKVNLIVFSFCLLSCNLVNGLRNLRQPPPTISISQCPTEKIAFTQETGCQNDGYFEFCIPDDDPEALAAVIALAPTVTCLRAGGRAGCHTDSEYLCMVPTRGLCQAGSQGAMNDQGWQMACNLASLTSVRKVVPTWYE